MTAEETELTFIRCPSCRSLVPSIATRCRMCGTQFDKKGAENNKDTAREAEDNISTSRVRQRTISAAPEQVEDIKRQAIAAANERANVIREEAPPQQIDYGRQNQSGFAPGRDLDDDIDDSYSREEEEYEGGEEEADFESDDTSSQNIGGGAFPASEGGRRRRRRRRKRRKHGTQGGGLQNMNAPAQEAGTAQFERDSQQVSRQPANFERDERRYNNPVPSPQNNVSSTPTHAPVQSSAPGTLLAWIVNFSTNPKGIAYEVRSGRFFIGRQQLRGHDLVIDQQSISTPHCMLVADANEGLFIQDLMSEKGTYIRSANSHSFQQISSNVKLQHGDWLKLGEYELMVCLLPNKKV